MVMVKAMATKEMIKYFTFGKEEREKQKPSVDQGKCIKYVFVFGTQGTIEGVSDL